MSPVELEERMNSETWETTSLGEHMGAHRLQPVSTAADTEIMIKKSAELEEKMNPRTWGNHNARGAHRRPYITTREYCRRY
jgi:hypothetical protein